MSLIEKIDAEIERVSRIPIFNDCTDTDEIFDEGKKSGWYEEAVRIKEIILSEQKEPCELCNWFKGMKAPIPEIESELGEEIIYKSKEINCCPNCGRQLNQPYTE